MASDRAFSKCLHLLESHKREKEPGSRRGLQPHESNTPLCEGLVGLFYVSRQISQLQFVLQDLNLRFIIRLQISHVPSVLLSELLPDSEERRAINVSDPCEGLTHFSTLQKFFSIL